MTRIKQERARTGFEIAVVGMSGRFPGAGDIHEFWENLKNGIESLSFFTKEELEAVGVSREMLDNPAYICAAGGVLENKGHFDAYFFNFSPGEAEVMDPQQRVLHQCAWSALEDAGYIPGDSRYSIGIFAGSSPNFHWEALALISGKYIELGTFAASQLIDRGCLSTRISYLFNLKGPGVTVQTTCSTSLVAVHMACRAILGGECDMALAGGVAVKSVPGTGYLYKEGMILSRDGHCRAFDNEAGGTVAGEGAGIVVLKSLEEALKDRDHIYAVVKSTAVNNDGSAKVGYSAPAVDGQAAVIRAALHMAEVEPESVTYIETHGTGTTLGDPVEIEALKLAYGVESGSGSQVKGHYCGIGSVKTNIGHLDAAAGIAGFIKTVLALKYRAIPPSLNFNSSNEKIDFKNSPFFVVQRLIPWENKKYPLRAGVSAFGIGGTNAHAVLEEPPEYNMPGVESKHLLLLLSARTPSALDKTTANIVKFLKDGGPDSGLANAAYTLKIGRKAFEHRRMVVCSDAAEAVEALSTSGSRKVRSSLAKDLKRPVIFMFSGLGPQYVNMGLELYRGEPMFREEMDRCFELLAPLLEEDPGEILYPSRVADKTDFDRPEIAQSMLFIIEYSLARLLIRWGIRPYAMIGYSFGEYTAACISGVFALEDALKLVVNRGKLIGSIHRGAMLSVPLTMNELTPLLGSELTAAIDNGLSCIAAGPVEAVDAFEKRMNEKKILCMRIQGAHAIHSMMMDPILDAFKESVSRFTLNEPNIPYISNVTGYWLSSEDARDPIYWVRHLRDTVQFAAGMRELSGTQNAVFVEVGPGRTLSTLIRQFFDDESQPAVVNLIKQSNEEVHDHRYFLDKTGQLWLYGITVDWTAVYQGEQRQRVPLPTYPFEGRRYWIDIDLSSINGKFLLEKPANPGETVHIDGTDIPMSHENLETRDRHPALTSPYEPPRDEIERQLTSIWQDFFGLVPVGIQDDFFELGGDSLKAMTLLSKIRKEMNVEITLAEFFDHSCIRGLAQLNFADRMGRGAKDLSVIEKAEKMEYYPLSPAQQRLYVLQQGNPHSVVYNMPGIFTLEGDFDMDRAKAAFNTLIKRHESFRTSFHLLGDQPVQVIHSPGEVGFEVEYFDITGDPGMKNSILGRFIRPFDLSKLPLVRIGVIKVEEKKSILTVDMHHTISDGISALIVGRQFVPLYRGESLPEFRIQYKDYSQWQNRRIRQGEMEKQENFWLKEFEGKLPELALPMDFPRSGDAEAEGGSFEFILGREETLKLKKVAKEENVTMFALILSIYYVLLYKLTGQEDIIIGTVTAGRRHADLEMLIGMFVNTLALRNFPAGGKLFTDFLKEVKNRSLQAFDNQDYQFGDLVDILQIHREPGRQPLFDVLFTFGGDTRTKYDSGPIDPLNLKIDVEPGLKIKAYDSEEKRSMFDLVLGCFDFSTAMQFNFNFSRSLFKAATIERFVKYLKEIILAVADNKLTRLKDIKVSLELEALKSDVYSSVESDFDF